MKARKNLDYDEMVQQRLDLGYSREKIDEEIAAQYFGAAMAMRGWREEQIKKDPGFWQKVIDHVRAFLKEVRDALEKWSGEDMAVKAAMETDVETLDQFCDMFQATLDQLTEEKGEKKAETETEEPANPERKGVKIEGPESILDEETKYSYAGVGSETADKTMLEQAMQMEKDGADSEEIRQATGLFRGYDGKWRYEIDDSKLKIDLNGLYMRNPDVRRYNTLMQKFLYDMPTQEEIAELKALEPNLKGVNRKPEVLGDMIEHSELLDAYPQLADISVKFGTLDDASGTYYPRSNEIYIHENLLKDTERMKKTLLHEVQHAIQHIEGFANGSNEFYWAGVVSKEEIRKKAEAEIREIMKDVPKDLRNKYDRYKDLDRVLTELLLADGDLDEEKYTHYDEIQDALYEELHQYDWFRQLQYAEGVLNDPGEAYESLYKRTAGEVEARDTAARADLTAAQRKETRPDIDRTDVVFADKKTYSFAFDIDNKDTESKFIIDSIKDNIDKISSDKTFDVKYDSSVENYNRKSDYVMNVFDEDNNIAYNHTLGAVDLVRSGAKSTIMHGFGPYKLAAVKAIKTVIEKGDIVKVIKNYKNTSVDRYVIAGKGDIDSKECYVGVMIKAYPNQKKSNAKFYLHEATIIEIDSNNMTEPQLSVDSVNESTSKNNITQTGEKSQDNSQLNQSRDIKNAASMTDDRIDYLIRDSGAGSRKDYAQKWITKINPSAFLDLTLKEFADRDKFDKMPGDYGSTVENYDYMTALKTETRQTPYLAVNVDTGEIVGHEGRHRMRALEKAGITEVPIVIEMRDSDGYLIKELNGYGNSLKILDNLHLKNQYGTDYEADVENVIPLNEANRENVMEAYGREDADIRYSRELNNNAVEYVERLKGGSRQRWEMLDILEDLAEGAYPMEGARLGEKDLIKLAKDFLLTKEGPNENVTQAQARALAQRLGKADILLSESERNVDTVLYGLYKILLDDVKSAGHYWTQDWAKEFRKEFKDNGKLRKVYIPENVRTDVTERFGGEKGFRQRMRGILKIVDEKTADSVDLDEFYEELRDKGYALPETTQPSHKILNILSAWGAGEGLWYSESDGVEYNGMSVEEVATDRAIDLMTEMMTVGTKGAKKFREWSKRIRTLKEEIRTEKREGVLQIVSQADAYCALRIAFYGMSGRHPLRRLP